MSDIGHSDYCPEDNGGDLEDCPTCTATVEKEQAYYAALYRREHHYSIDELRDAYSHPTDRHKLMSLEREGA